MFFVVFIFYQVLRLHLCFLYFKLLDFASTLFWIRRSDFTFAFFNQDIQISPSHYGSNIQTSSTSHFLVPRFRCSDFIFRKLGIHTSPLYESDVQTSSASHFRHYSLDVQTLFSTDCTFRLRLCVYILD